MKKKSRIKFTKITKNGGGGKTFACKKRCEMQRCETSPTSPHHFFRFYLSLLKKEFSSIKISAEFMKTKIGTKIVEWDDKKNSLNKKKHGIDFYTAALVFADSNRLEFFDSEHSAEEDRYIVLGRVKKVLFVVYTERGQAARIISARLATKMEACLYYGND